MPHQFYGDYPVAMNSLLCDTYNVEILFATHQLQCITIFGMLIATRIAMYLTKCRDREVEELKAMPGNTRTVRRF